jgi:hypothetical protein
MKKALPILFYFMLLIAVKPNDAKATFINFDDVSTNNINGSAVIDNYYSNLGVTFSCYDCSNIGGPDIYAVNSSYSSSPPNVISVLPVALGPTPGMMNVQQGYIQANFAVPQDFVSIDWTTTFDSAPTNPTGGPFIEAYDTSGNLLKTALSPFANCSFQPINTCNVLPGAPYTLSVQDSIANIAFVRISAGTIMSNGTVTIDNAFPGDFDNLSFFVPLPGSVYLFGTGLIALVIVIGMKRNRIQGLEGHENLR